MKVTFTHTHTATFACTAATTVNMYTAISQASFCSSTQPLSVLIIFLPTLSSSFSSYFLARLNLKSALHNLIWNYNLNHALIPCGYQFRALLSMSRLQIRQNVHDVFMLCMSKYSRQNADVVLISLAGPTSCLWLLLNPPDYACEQRASGHKNLPVLVSH